MMEALEAIFSRHSVPNVRPDPVAREVVERLLAAAAQAPNHYKVRPWRFVVLQGAARERLGDLLAQILKEEHPELAESGLDKERAKPLRAPVLIAVGVGKAEDSRELPQEDLCAAAAACENLLLAAHSLGLGGMWRTGAPVSNPRVKAFLGLDPDQPLIGLLYIGYPNENQPPAAERPSFEDRTNWME
jgi:nitroreductase